jgi:hypothetical protein
MPVQVMRRDRRIAASVVAPSPGTFGSFVNFVMPGRKPSGSVGVQVLPPSNVALTAQPSLKFQSFAPVIRFCGFAGFTASGVSFCESWSFETSTTRETPIRPLPAPAPTAIVAAIGRV